MDLATFHARTAWHAHVNDRQYAAPADPYALVDVDPNQVRAYTNELRLDLGLGRVHGGEWDAPENREPVEETTAFRALHERFEQGHDWTETALYDRAASAFADGDQFRGYESLEAFREQRCAYLDDLYDAIATEGYRPNAAADHDPATTENPFETAYAHELEPLVGVGRDGSVLWTEGFHRFVIARLHDLDTIPVQVVCRHERWQETRDLVHEAATDDAEPSDGANPADVAAARGTSLDHPDLQDLRP